MKKSILGILLIITTIFVYGCTDVDVSQEAIEDKAATKIEQQINESLEGKEVKSKLEKLVKRKNVSSKKIPNFAGEPYIVLDDNIPKFTLEEKKERRSFENYGALDYLGRCQTATARIGRDLMPTEERGSIGMIKPVGWHTIKYDFVDGKYLYNRCHLIGYQLTAENANEKNLITGTRYLNMQGMLPFENMVADYVKETGNKVLYRVTPIYDGDDLLSKGVQMEGWSVEDEGKGICFNVFAYNAQPGVKIKYATGESWEENNETSNAGKQETATDQEKNIDAILNVNAKKIHTLTCKSVKQMSESNKKYFQGNPEKLLEEGYEFCKNCHK